MKYNLFINQKYLYEKFGTEITLNESCVFDVIYNIISCYKNFKYLLKDDKYYVWIHTSLITSELPLLNVGSRQIKNIISKLVELQLLEMYEHNKTLQKTYICLGKNAYNINSDFKENTNEKNFIPNNEINSNISAPMKNISNTYEINLPTPMKNTSHDYNTNYSLTNENNTNIKEEELQKSKDFCPPPDKLTSKGVYEKYIKEGKFNYRGNLFFTDKEIETLKSKWNADKLEENLDALDNWLNKPKNWLQAKNHYLTVNRWINDGYKEALKGGFSYQVDLEWKANNNEKDYTDIDMSKQMLVEDF